MALMGIKYYIKIMFCAVKNPHKPWYCIFIFQLKIIVLPFNFNSSAVLQGMWEDSQNNLKWLVVHKCYFPDDLPEEVGRPGVPQSNEVHFYAISL